jgi:DNA modification methylase
MILNGDSKVELKQLEDNSVDAVITDPPYGISFMGKNWDKALPEPEIFQECFRVLKPGAFAMVMVAPRSDVQSRMSILLEDVGFNIAFTPIYWTYTTGFPKAMDIKKALDKKGIDGSNFEGAKAGFQPKPAVEVVIIAMKPLSEKTYVDQVLSNGKGVTWLDDCRIPYKKEDIEITKAKNPHTRILDIRGNNYNSEDAKNKAPLEGSYKVNDGGRFPANLLVQDQILGEHSRFFDLDRWQIIPKASKSEKGDGNTHPTVKPLKLMQWLITLTTRPGEVVLDPFAGSGTTLVAAAELGREYIGIELTEEYITIIKKRIAEVST